MNVNSFAVIFLINMAEVVGHSTHDLNNCLKYLSQSSFRTAASFCISAADQGSALAQYNLGVMYYSGKGVEQSYSEALLWYFSASAQGNKWAQHNIGFLYENGHGVEQSYPDALYWYKKASSRGIAWPRQFPFGVILLEE